MNRLFINCDSSSYQFPVPSYPFINQNIFIYASYIKTKTPTHPTPNEPLSLPSICFQFTAHSSNVTYAARNFFDWISISHFRPDAQSGKFRSQSFIYREGRTLLLRAFNHRTFPDQAAMSAGCEVPCDTPKENHNAVTNTLSARTH